MSYIITTNITGQIGIKPRNVRVISTDNLIGVTTPGYLSATSINGLEPTDIIEMVYGLTSLSPPSNDGTVGIFKVRISNGIATLSSALPSVTIPTTAGYVAVFADAEGNIRQSEPGSQAQNPGDYVAGTLGGTGGGFASWPNMTLTGSLYIYASPNTDNYPIAITNAEFGQSTSISIPDPGASSSNIVVTEGAGVLTDGNLVKAVLTDGVVTDAGYKIISATTAVYGGGGTSNEFAATGLTVASVGSAVIRASTNAVSICKALPGTDTLTITFSADPGANTIVDYIYTSVATP